MIVQSDIKKVEKLFTVFLILLFSEGLFRRWIFPGSGNIFMVLRDPIVFYIVFKWWRLLDNKFAIFTFYMAFITFITSLIFGHHSILVAIYGMRITCLYIPAIYIFGNALSKKYIQKVGKVFLIIFIPIVLLTILQFLSPPGAFVNKGRGEQFEDSLSSSGDLNLRPCAFFMSIVGLTDFYFIIFAFIFIFINDKQKKKLLSKKTLMVVVLLYVISIPVSISRTHFFMTIVALITYLLFSKRKGMMITYAIFLCFIAAIISQTSFMKPFTDVFTNRLTLANATEGGAVNSMQNRTFGYAFGVLEGELPIFGYGDGYCTNIGIKIIHGTVGVSNISNKKIVDRLEASEMEWSRLLTEQGSFFGLISIFLRIAMSLQFINLAIRNVKKGNQMPLYFLPPAAVFMATGQIKVPTNLGFLLVACTLFMASCKKQNIN